MGDEEATIKARQEVTMAILALLSGNGPQELECKIDEYVINSVCKRKYNLGFNSIYVLASVIEEKYDVPSDKLIAFCNARYGSSKDPSYYLAFVEALWQTLELQVGLAYATDAIVETFQSLRFDKDNLLTGPSELVTWKNEGVLIGSEHFVPFAKETTYYRLYEFWSRLLKVRAEQGTAVQEFGIAVRPDMIMDAQLYYEEALQKAYMYGPKGISEADLLSPDFPADYEGTETEHRRVDHDNSYNFDVDVLQVRWSASKDKNSGTQVKSVEIEELVPLSTSLFEFENYIANRYIHAEWDMDRCCFRHFDAALRIYDKNDYERRLRGKVKKATDFRQTHKKLFRIDGDLDVKTWSDLTALFFSGNELVVEYLGGADTEI